MMILYGLDFCYFLFFVFKFFPHNFLSMHVLQCLFIIIEPKIDLILLSLFLLSSLFLFCFL